MFTRLLQATLITSAVYVTLLISPQQSLKPSGVSPLINAQLPSLRRNQPLEQINWIKQQLAKAVDAISQPTQSNARL